MVEASSGVNPQSATSVTGAEQSAASGTAPSQGKTIPNSFDGTLGGLKELDEELYNRMMESLAMNICNEWKKDQAEAKKKRKEYERWIRGD